MALNNAIRGFGEDVKWNAHNGEPVKSSSGRFIEVEEKSHHRYFYDMSVTDEEFRCPSLTSDNKCMTHVGKALLHRAWPMIPEQVEVFDQCSYIFEEVERRVIKEGE